MIFIAPATPPRGRLEMIESSARHVATHPPVREFARGVYERLAAPLGSRDGVDVVPIVGELVIARALLAIVAAPRYQGDTEPDANRGQWLDPNVLVIVRDGGDCVDRTHALLALAFASGLEGQAVWLFEPATLDHVAPRVRVHGVYLWADPLLRPATLGVAPRSQATLVSSGPSP